ncbi:hypothetical protein [Streptosporangium sp. NPDC049644]
MPVVFIGIVAAFIGTAVATVLGVADTRGIDWIERWPSRSRWPPAAS